MTVQNFLVFGIKHKHSLKVPLWLSRSFAMQNSASKIDKNLLTDFKKKTGYSFAKCNEALKKFDNNVGDAESWLHEQAEKEGWTKAKKLQSRTTNQGLVGVVKKNNFAALVEVSCETDFAARNELFQELVAVAADSTLAFRQNVILQNQKIDSSGTNQITHLREMLLQHELLSLPVVKSNMSLQDYLVSLVGKLGENIKFKRALAVATHTNNIIGTACHGNSSAVFDNCRMGTFASCVVLKPLNIVSNVEEAEKLSTLANALSQHVIGMNPKSIDVSNGVDIEDALLHQEYLINDKIKVSSLLKEAHCEVVDFIRYSLNE